MNAPRVSVVTAVRNGGRFLAETIASIRAQTFTDWEYIIVDDASDDDTRAVVEEQMRVDSRLRLLRREHSGGPYVAANDGVRAALGEYIIRIDGDDLSPPYRIAHQLSYLKAHGRYRACVSYVQFFDDRGVQAHVSAVPASPRVLRWYLLLRGMSTHSSLCIERAALLELGCYRELHLAQDYRLLCELTRRDWLGIMPEVLSYVRQHERRASVSMHALQRSLALDIMAEHLRLVAGERWTRADIEALYAVGHAASMSVGQGLDMLDRWDRGWRAATDLTRDDRCVLAQLSGFRRWKHLRSNLVREPIQVLAAMARPSVLRSCLGLLRSSGEQLPRDGRVSSASSRVVGTT